MSRSTLETVFSASKHAGGKGNTYSIALTSHYVNDACDNDSGALSAKDDPLQSPNTPLFSSVESTLCHDFSQMMSLLVVVHHHYILLIHYFTGANATSPVVVTNTTQTPKERVDTEAQKMDKKRKQLKNEMQEKEKKMKESNDLEEKEITLNDVEDKEKRMEKLKNKIEESEEKIKKIDKELDEKKRKIGMKEKERNELWKKMTEVMKEVENKAFGVTVALLEMPCYDQQIMTRKTELSEITQKLTSDRSSPDTDELQQQQRKIEFELGVAEADSAKCRFKITAYTRPANAYIQLEVSYTRLDKHCATLNQECNRLVLEYDLLEQERDKLRSELADLQNSQ